MHVRYQLIFVLVCHLCASAWLAATPLSLPGGAGSIIQTFPVSLCYTLI